MLEIDNNKEFKILRLNKQEILKSNKREEFI